jgi:hypothetical protein
MLESEGEEATQACDTFFATKLPMAVLSIARPKASIYEVSAIHVTLPALFAVMEEARQGNSGFNYYTCSSSSLERVFMEIVHLSEIGDSVEIA